MANLNRQMLLGRVGSEPTIRTFDSGAKIANVSLAVSDYHKDKNGEMQESTNWFRLRFFGKSADTVEKYVHKGDQLYAEGPNVYSEYKDKDGQTRGMWEVKVMSFQLISQKQDNRQDTGRNQDSMPAASDFDDMPAF